MQLSNYAIYSWLLVLLAKITSINANHNAMHSFDGADDSDHVDVGHRDLAIIDADNRQNYSARKNGILFLEGPSWFGKNCTATLVAAEYAVTARSCTSTLPNWIAQARVHFNYHTNSPAPFSGNVVALFQSEYYGGFALLRISPKADIGKMTLFTDKLAAIRSANMVGYMFNSAAGVHYCCPVKGIEPSDKRIKHECDGTEGAPLFLRTKSTVVKNGRRRTLEKYLLLGVQNGLVEIDNVPLYNLAVPGKAINDFLQVVLRANQPNNSNPVYTIENTPDPLACGLPKKQPKPTKPPVIKPVDTRRPTPKPVAAPPPQANPTRKPVAAPPPQANPTPKPVAAPPPQANPTPKPVAAPPPQANPTPKPVAAPPPQANPTPKPVAAPPPQANPTPKPVAAPPTPKPVKPTRKPASKPTCKNRHLTEKRGDDSDSECSDSDDDDPNPTRKPVAAPPTPKPVKPTRKPASKPTCKNRHLTEKRGDDSDSECSDSDDDDDDDHDNRNNGGKHRRLSLRA